MSGLTVLPRPPALEVQEPDARVQHVPEAALHDLWASGQFDTEAMRTTEGAAVTILHPGTLNRDGGPDFLGARLRIASDEAPSGWLDWTGDVEIHRTSGEWLMHRHHEDPRYDRVVLHVALIADRYTGTLPRADGTVLPEVILYDHLGTSLRGLLHRFYAQPRADFYCEAHWETVPETLKAEWIQRLGLSRLRAKAAALATAYAYQPDLNELLHAAVFRALGYAKNAEPMTELARRVPLPVIRRIEGARDVEALLFGVAGLLPDLTAMLKSDRHSADYVEDLRARFERLRLRMPLRPMNAVQWQFFRLRPANFPTRRLAQAAALLAPATATSEEGLLRTDALSHLRGALTVAKPLTALRTLIQQAEPDPFWADHVRFERPTTPMTAHIGRSRTDRIVMDALLPVLLLDAEQREDAAQHEQVATLLASLPAASDEITRRFERHGTSPDSALATQGLHQLYRRWCTEGRCLSCAIGKAVLGRAS